MLAKLLPADVMAVIGRFLTAELTTLGRDGVPITWPIMPIFYAPQGRFIVLTSIGLPQKAFNIRRDPRVALLFSDPTGSGLDRAPAVLVQGTASVGDRILVSRQDWDPPLFAAILDQARQMLRRQPAMALYLRWRLTRTLMDWYFMRLLITITPQRIMWWPAADFSRRPEQWEVTHVAPDQPVPAAV